MRTRTRPALALLALFTATGLGVAGLQGETPSMEELIEQAQPGPEHERLAALAGEWDVVMQPVAGAETAGTGRAETILGGRFLVVDFSLGEGGAGGSYRYTLGFDRRHGEWSIVALDTSGTYFVTARGPQEDGTIRMAGTDDDPYMQSLGFEKKFVFELGLDGPDEFELTTWFVDTRTAEEPLIRAADCRFTRR